MTGPRRVTATFEASSPETISVNSSESRAENRDKSRSATSPDQAREPEPQASSGPRPPLSLARKLLFSALCLALLLVLLGLGELTARVYYRGRFPDPTIYHPRRSHAHRPGWQGFEGKPSRGLWVRINSLGLRDDRELKKGFDGQRVLLVGDSVAFGYRLDQKETISAVLEKNLLAAGGAWQVLNVGCFGYGVQDSVDWLRELRGQLQAQQLVMLVCYNDFGQLTTMVEDAPPAWAATIADSSALGMSLTRKVHQLWAAKHRLSAGEVGRRFIVKDADAAASAAGVAERLSLLLEVATELGAKTRVLLWPSEDQLLEAKAGKGSPLIFKELFNYIEARPLGCKVVDLTPWLAAIKEDGLYMDHCHPSARGAALLADRLARELRE